MSVSKKDVIVNIEASGVIPVFYHADMDVLLRVLSICYQCGLRVFEFMQQRDNKGLRFFEHLAERLDEFPGLTLGVGTVLDAAMAERYIAAGAHYIASPFLRKDMGLVCGKDRVIWMPGCATFVEIEDAEQLGATVINVLPGNVLGVDFIATVKKQHRSLHLIPSGITDFKEKELIRWFEVGILALKVSTQVFTKEDISAKDWSKIEKNLTELLRNIKKAQSILNLTT